MRTQALFLLALVLTYSCQKPNEKCRLLKVTGSTSNTTYTYDSEDRLTSRITLSDAPNTIDMSEYQHEYDATGKLARVQVTQGSKANQPSYQFTYQYNENDHLVEVQKYDLEWPENTWEKDDIYRIVIENGRTVGYDVYYTDTLYARGVRWSEFHDGNFHRADAYAMRQGKKVLTSYAEYEYDKKCNPYFNQQHYIPYMSMYNENNIVARRIYQDNQLSSSSESEREYRKRLPVSSTATYDDGTETTTTYEYDCF